MSRPNGTSNRSLLLPYALPLLAYVGIASIPGEWGLPRALDYGLRLVACTLALVWGWRHYVSLRGPAAPLGSAALGAVAGVAGTALWVALKAPFYPAGGEAWGRPEFVLRLVASGTVVALFEELLFRGYVLRLSVQWERARRGGSKHAFGVAFDDSRVDTLEPGAWTPLAVGISTLAFAAGHQLGEFPAAIGYGLLMASLWIVRRDLVCCVVAHAVTNVSLALYVASSGDWTRW